MDKKDLGKGESLASTESQGLSQQTRRLPKQLTIVIVTGSICHASVSISTSKIMCQILQDWAHSTAPARLMKWTTPPCMLLQRLHRKI